MTDKQTAFSGHFDKAFAEHPGHNGAYTPNEKDIKYFETILSEGVLKGANLATVLPTAMRVVTASGAKISWYSVLWALAEHKRTKNKKKPSKPESLPPTVLEGLEKAGFTDEEVKKALEPRSMKAAQGVLKGLSEKTLTGWEFVELQAAHQVSEGLTTSTAFEKQVYHDQTNLSWDHYKAWKKAHVATSAPKGVNTIKKNWLFREWAAQGFPEEP